MSGPTQGSEFRGVTTLDLAQNNQKGGPRFYQRTDDPNELVEWVASGALVFVNLIYVEDAHGMPKNGSRASYAITRAWVDANGVACVERHREGSRCQWWRVIGPAREYAT